MIIKSITLNNYRLYKGENTLSLSSSDEKNIVLISGENGFGKTTFLHSLIWCLYGKLMIEVEVLECTGLRVFNHSYCTACIYEQNGWIISSDIHSC